MNSWSGICQTRIVRVPRLFAGVVAVPVRTGSPRDVAFDRALRAHIRDHVLWNERYGPRCMCGWAIRDSAW